MIVKNSKDLSDDKLKSIFRTLSGIRKRFNDIVVCRNGDISIVECKKKYYEEFIEFSAKRQNKELRLGQNLINSLLEYDYALYHKVKKSNVDCYYDNNVLPTLNYLKKEWEK